jgi:hypothetical protein
MQRILSVLLSALLWHSLPAADISKPATASAKPVGPEVDVTLKSGESRQGQLLEFANGSLTLKLPSGETLTKDRGSVMSVRFILPVKALETVSAPLLSAPATQLSVLEITRLQGFRRDARKESMSKEDEAEYKKLRAKVEVHIQALEREIANVSNEEEARASLQELGRYYWYYGSILPDLRIAIRNAVSSIKNEKLRKDAEAHLPVIMQNVEEHYRPKKPFDIRPRDIKAPAQTN